MSRRRAFAAALAALDIPIGQAAGHLGVSYNHLLLVLDGTRRGSARLEGGIRGILDEAKPLLGAIVDGAFDAPTTLRTDTLRDTQNDAPRTASATAMTDNDSTSGADQPRVLDTLRMEFHALRDEMQRPEVAAGIEQGFTASPAGMGSAAVSAASATRARGTPDAGSAPGSAPSGAAHGVRS